jgi:2-oxoglutarate dehydrogenase E2 component (dihydrolipoamide succinyltransferase)
MSIELKVPEIGESITEVEIGDWLKKSGDPVKKDDPIVTLESEKATVELPSPSAGTIGKVLKQKGDVAKVGEIIAYLEENSTQPVAPAEPQNQTTPETSTPSPPRSGGEVAREKGKTDGSEKKPETKSPDSKAPEAKPAEKPAPQKAEPKPERPEAEADLASPRLSQIKPSQEKPRGERLRETSSKDSRTEAESSNQPATSPPSPPQSGGEVALRAQGKTESADRPEEIVPMSKLRRTVAERLVEAQRNAALLTTFNEIDMSSVMALRKEHGEAFQKKYNVKLGFMSFFVKAAIDGLKQFPAINAEIRGTDVVYHNYFDIGVAIGSGKGLVVPVLRNAERMSFAEIEMAIGDLGRRAQENKLKPDELHGGTFTITNGGVYGSLLSTPIVNPPQSGVLGMHGIQDRPVAREGQVVIRPMMYVALTYDHRLVDGREAVTFLKRIKDTIENPARMLIEA